MGTSAQDRKPQPPGKPGSGQWTSTQAYVLAIITLVIGVGIGWIVRGSGSADSHPAEAATATNTPMPGGMGASMPPGQLPGFGTQGQQKPPIEELNRAAEPMLQQLKQNPNNTELLTKLGNLYYDGQAYQQAINYYQEALKIDPKDVNVRTDMATCIWYTGDPDTAIKQFEKSLSYNPTHPGTLFNMGVVKWQGKRDPKGAVAAWEKLLQTNPDYPEKQKVQDLLARARMHGDQQFDQTAPGSAGSNKANPFPTPF